VRWLSGNFYQTLFCQTLQPFCPVLREKLNIYFDLSCGYIPQPIGDTES
jgi:hypothetical protein